MEGTYWQERVTGYHGDQRNIPTNRVNDRLKLLKGLVDDIEKERENSARTLKNIEAMERSGMEQRPVRVNPQPQLNSLYLTAINEASREVDILQAALNEIYNIRRDCDVRKEPIWTDWASDVNHRASLMKSIQISAHQIPLWVGKPAVKPPPLVGAVPPEPSYTASPRDLVAALVEGVEEGECWILAEVVGYNSFTKRYEVVDIYEEDRPVHRLSRKKVVPLPVMRANPETHPEALFAKGATVMALYPQTTCFYKAVVNGVPANCIDDYELLFEDSAFPSGYAPPLKVPQRYVIVMREIQQRFIYNDEA